MTGLPGMLLVAENGRGVGCGLAMTGRLKLSWLRDSRVGCIGGERGDVVRRVWRVWWRRKQISAFGWKRARRARLYRAGTGSGSYARWSIQGLATAPATSPGPVRVGEEGQGVSCQVVVLSNCRYRSPTDEKYCCRAVMNESRLPHLSQSFNARIPCLVSTPSS